MAAIVYNTNLGDELHWGNIYYNTYNKSTFNEMGNECEMKVWFKTDIIMQINLLEPSFHMWTAAHQQSARRLQRRRKDLPKIFLEENNLILCLNNEGFLQLSGFKSQWIIKGVAHVGFSI